MVVQDRGVLQQSARANGKVEDVLEMRRCAGGCEAGAGFGCFGGGAHISYRP